MSETKSPTTAATIKQKNGGSKSASNSQPVAEEEIVSSTENETSEEATSDDNVADHSTTVNAVDEKQMQQPSSVNTDSSVSPAHAVLSHDASTMEAVLREYSTLMGKPIINDAGIMRGIELLNRATAIAVNSPQDDARDLLWTFHQNHQHNLMSERMALRGVKKLIGKQGLQVSLVYSLLHHAVTKSDMRIDDQRAIAETSRRFVVWLGTKK